MNGSPNSSEISTRLERIAKLAQEIRGAPLRNLAHHIDVAWLREAFRRTRKDGARGIDGQSGKEYEEHLEDNLEALLARVKAGRYRAPPVKRVHLPKGDGTTRPIGIPTFEDKVLQRAVAMLFEAVYEQSFHDFSYGFRPGRSAHQALTVLREAARRRGGWLVEVDIKQFFDTLDHRHLQEILSHRICDRALLRLIGKWLNAGVLEGDVLSHPDAGTPQGGVISPVLANIYLHEVLDDWFVTAVRPRLRGRVTIVRYADDIAVLFERKIDAERFLDVLPKRFGRYGLTLHPSKTRMVPFERPRRDGFAAARKPGTFDLLGFTHYWALSRNGFWVVKRRTAKDRFRRALHRLTEWCREHRHDPVETQHATLVKKLEGHYAYYGVTSNYDALGRLRHRVTYAWKKWLSRRSQKGYVTWPALVAMMKRYPLPSPRIAHQST